MKTHLFQTLMMAGLLLLAPALARSQGAGLSARSSAAGPFIHPGMLHSHEELEFIKKKITAGAEPWKTAWGKLRASGPASLDYRPRPRAEVVRGPYNNPNIGSSELSNDSAAAYTHALQWNLTGNEAHARKAIEILNAWSAILKTISGHDTKLLIGMEGVKLCNAAELLRHTYTGWLKPDQERFERLLREILYPPIKDFFPAANGNWDAAMIQTMLAMGVFLDDRAMFNRAVDYYLKGEGNGAINNYFNAFGECQESGRDQAHTQMGLGFLGCAAEMAWKQGVDLYGASSNRLAVGFEYTAKYNLGHDVPYEPYRSFDGKYFYRSISRDSRGRFAPIYERIVYHYHGRKGFEMPHSRQVAAKGGAGSRSGGAHVPWGALMFAELPANVGRAKHPVWKADASSEFEVGTQIRAWTIRDEGMDTILDNMQSMCGVNSLYMVAVMHAEHRPFQAPQFPHNPARASWEAEDSRVTFFPEMSRYGKIKPLLSDVDWIRETDWLKLMVEACRARGMATGAEVSHYPIPKSLIKSHPDWQQKTIDGSSWKTDRFCPNHPDVREYVVALFGDLAANYDLDYIQTCQHLFDQNNSVDKDGTCFCQHCIAEAKKTGFDLEAAIPKLRANKDSQPEKELWLKFKRHSTTEFYRLISEEIQRVKKNPNCHLRYNDTYPYRGWDPRNLGMYIDDVSQHLGSLVNQDHEEEKGRADETFERRKSWLETNRRLIGPDKPLISGIAPRIKATPELVKAGIKVALEHPAQVNGLCLKHYDGASFGLMRAFKQGMIEAGVQGLPPTIGKEVEDMRLEDFQRIDDYVEESGVETSGQATASYRFDEASGNYDVRISYFDQKDGQGKVQLFVGTKEALNFRLDEEVNCWRWRLFKNVPVNRGDEIKLVAEADGKEPVRLDFVEFIPVKR